MEKSQNFKGDQKVGKSLLSRPEQWFVRSFIGYVPKRIETYHLTLMTLLWSLLIIVFCYLSRQNILWLHMVSVCIAMQYITDVFDGAIGRKRETGLIKWGFFMDHFLDYIFLCSLILGYAIVAPPGLEFQFFVLLILTGGFIVTAYLNFAATNEFQVYFFGLGPTEFRGVLILINTSVVFTGVKYFPYSVPLLCVICFLALVFLVNDTQKKLWKIDMEAKEIKMQLQVADK